VPVPEIALPLSAEYILETNYIMVTHDNSYYALLTEAEAFSCMTSPFCTLLSPTYNLQTA
jgi:hypothetical protein